MTWTSCLLVFAYLFVGDFKMLGIPGFALIWAAIVAFRGVQKISFAPIEIKAQLLVFMSVTLYLFREVVTANGYGYGFIYAVLLVNVWPLITSLKSNKDAYDLMFILALAFGVLGLATWASRDPIVFGPNILYRIYGCIFLLAAISAPQRAGGLVFILVPLILAILSTHSRGGILVVTFLMAYQSYRLFKRDSKWMGVLLVVLAVFALGSYWGQVELLLGRGLQISIEDLLQNERSKLWSKALEFLKYGSGMNILFGVGAPNAYYPEQGLYPHNLVVEMLVYNGMLGLVLFLTCSTLAFIRLANWWSHEALLFVPILIGSLLSGSMEDHGYLWAVPWCALLFQSTRTRLGVPQKIRKES
jgi:hypothetical protein